MSESLVQLNPFPARYTLLPPYANGGVLGFVRLIFRLIAVYLIDHLLSGDLAEVGRPI